MGYDVRERKVVVNGAEAPVVRDIFRRYLDLGCVRRLKQSLERDGIRSKKRILPDGTLAGDRPISRGSLYLMLSNPIYIGQIRHGNLHHSGLHQAIIERDLWDAVQTRLANNAAANADRTQGIESSPLAGLLYDASGEGLTPSHANKKGRRYRYYVSRALVTGTAKDHPQGWRLPAPDMERAVGQAAAAILQDGPSLTSVLTEAGIALAVIPVCLSRLAAMAEKLDAADDSSLLPRALRRVEIADDSLTLTLSLSAMLPDYALEDVILTRTIPMHIRRRGVEIRLIVGEIKSAAKADPAVVKAIARGRKWWNDLQSGAMPSMGAIAKEEGITEGYVGQLLPLAFLAPSIVEAIVGGNHPPDLTAETLIKRITLPLDWEQQRALLGCG